MERPPLLVCPYDAELFGHWWYEGPYWIEQVIRGLAKFEGKMELLSPIDYLGLYFENQVAQPCFSSWGNKGYAEVWLEGSNDWIYRHLHTASDHMVELSRRFPDEKGIRGRALNQAARELLLSQSSDWAFIMKTGTTVPYAVKRTREHIYNFNRLYQALTRNEIDQEWLLGLEKKNNCFADIDYRVYSS
jgi:1,4-alpha-glucan branching enzyme